MCHAHQAEQQPVVAAAIATWVRGDDCAYVDALGEVCRTECAPRSAGTITPTPARGGRIAIRRRWGRYNGDAREVRQRRQ